MSFNVSGLNLFSGNIHGSSLRATRLKSKAKGDSPIDPEMEKELLILRQNEKDEVKLSASEQHNKDSRESIMRSAAWLDAVRLGARIEIMLIQPIEQLLASGIDPNTRISDMSADEIENLPWQFRDQIRSINRSLNIDPNNPDPNLSHLLEMIDLSEVDINSLKWNKEEITPFIDPNITLFDVILDNFDRMISNTLTNINNSNVFRDENGVEFEDSKIIINQLSNFYKSDVFNSSQVNNFEELLQFLSNTTVALRNFSNAQFSKAQQASNRMGQTPSEFISQINRTV